MPTPPHKVAPPVVALDFNEVVAVDILWFDTAESSNQAALNVVDLASTYQVVIPLQRMSVEPFAQDGFGGLAHPSSSWLTLTQP